MVFNLGDEVFLINESYDNGLTDIYIIPQCEIVDIVEYHRHKLYSLKPKKDKEYYSIFRSKPISEEKLGNIMVDRTDDEIFKRQFEVVDAAMEYIQGYARDTKYKSLKTVEKIVYGNEIDDRRRTLISELKKYMPEKGLCADPNLVDMFDEFYRNDKYYKINVKDDLLVLYKDLELETSWDLNTIPLKLLERFIEIIIFKTI